MGKISSPVGILVTLVMERVAGGKLLCNILLKDTDSGMSL